MINFYNLKQQYQDQQEEINQAIQLVASSGQYFANNEVEKFEKIVSRAYADANVVACNSGTSALTLALKSLNLKRNSLVAVPSITYVGTANAVLAAGHYPVCIDIDDHWLMDLQQLEEQTSLTERFSAVVLVDLYGQGADLKSFKNFCDSRNLKLVVDAAQSFNMHYHNYNQIDYCDVLSLSFNPLKNLGAMGNAGAVVYKDFTELPVRQLNVQGKDRKRFIAGGSNTRIDAMQAAILNVKHLLFHSNMARKQQINDYFRQQLSNLVEMPLLSSHTNHMNYVFSIAPVNTNKVLDALEANNIEFSCHYDQPLHHYKLFSDHNDYCPKATRLSGRCISLPNHWHLTDLQVEHIVQVVKTAL